ncbi:MAG: mannitol dehydrogenase family protein [Treponema sp.]|nr:mannitol dehydrogenase family protein [Treponema sp.]
MKLTLEGIKNTKEWNDKGITLPSYDIEKVAKCTKDNPVWVHFGVGNIFRMFIGGLADTLLEKGLTDKGITCVESFDFDVADMIYKPYNNLVLGVTLNADGSTAKHVIGSLSEIVKADSSQADEWSRLEKIFENPGLQMVSFTITEKGYALKGADGSYFPFILKDLEAGPQKPGCAMTAVTALLLHRFNTNKAPIAVVSMDNCSHNGEKLKASITTVAAEWHARGFVDDAFVEYVNDESRVSFPWSMIDKITPRPAASVCEELKKLGVEDMDPVVTSRRTYIAPFVNAEGPQYLVIEDTFPNGRPPLEKAGVYFTDRETVNKVERMKVTTCLNPLHTALAVYGCVLGYTLIADEMKDADLNKLVHQIGPVEGMPVVTDPGIISPKAFVDEVINVRIPNPFMPDTPQRIATDTSQKVGIRYGETIKSYVQKYGDAKKLKAIPLAIAGWCRYILGVDDNNKPFELSSDPMLEELQQMVKGIVVGKPETYTGQLKPLLSNAAIFGIDLYKAGIGDTVEALFKQLIAGPGAVRSTLHSCIQ